MWKRNLVHQKQPNSWSCLPAAFATVTDLSVKQIIETIGHDGSEIIFPDLEEPFCRRSFHIQELIDVCMLRNFAVVEIQNYPSSIVDAAHIYRLPRYRQRLYYYLANYTGVLTGIGHKGKPHAVAWNGNEVLDPNGEKYNITRFTIDTFFLIVKFNITGF